MARLLSGMGREGWRAWVRVHLEGYWGSLWHLCSSLLFKCLMKGSLLICDTESTVLTVKEDTLHLQHSLV